MKVIILTQSLLTRFNNDVECRICNKVFEIGDKLIRTGKPSNPKFYCDEHYYAEAIPQIVPQINIVDKVLQVFKI